MYATPGRSRRKARRTLHKYTYIDMADYEPASSDLGSQALLKLRISFVLHSHTMDRYEPSTIDEQMYQKALRRCADASIAKKMKQVEQHLAEARVLIAERDEPIHKFIAKVQEPIFQFEEVMETYAEEVGSDNHSGTYDEEVGHAKDGNIRPSKAPRLR